MIVAGLKDAGHEVLLDVESLVPGDPWRARLHQWLGLCDGAVILLDRTSVESAWLRQEATILGWRQSLQPSLRVVPVFLGSFTPERLQDYDWATLEIDANQAARAASTELTGAAASELARQTVQGFAELALGTAASPMEGWIERVSEVLTFARGRALKEAAAALDVDDAELAYFPARDVAVARQLLHLGLKRGLRALDKLQQGMDKEHFAELVALVRPTWVRTDAGASLGALLAEEPRRMIIINTNETDIGRDYLGRARCLPAADRHLIGVSDPVGEGSEPEQLRRLELSLRRELGLRPNSTESQLGAAAASDDVERYVVLTGDAADPHVASAFQAKYEHVKVLLLPGLTLRNDRELGERLVEPRLDRDEVERMRRLEWELERMVRV